MCTLSAGKGSLKDVTPTSTRLRHDFRTTSDVICLLEGNISEYNSVTSIRVYYYIITGAKGSAGVKGDPGISGAAGPPGQKGNSLLRHLVTGLFGNRIRPCIKCWSSQSGYACTLNLQENCAKNLFIIFFLYF